MAKYPTPLVFPADQSWHSDLSRVGTHLWHPVLTQNGGRAEHPLAYFRGPTKARAATLPVLVKIKLLNIVMINFNPIGSQNLQFPVKH